MSRVKILSVFFLLVYLAQAADVSANYQGTFSRWYFNTDMRFTTDFTLSLVSGDVSSGDPANLVSGDTVCSGATLRVAPSYSSKWAVSSLDVVSIYPHCTSETYCTPIDSGPVSYNKNIKWLSPSVFDEEKTFGDANDYGTIYTLDLYDKLGTFYNEPVTWRVSSTEIYTDKEAGANVFCKGNLLVGHYDPVVGGTTTIGSSTLPSTSAAEFTVTNPGSHIISTRLSSASCFAAVDKHPSNRYDHPEFFYYYYFAHNQPAIPTAEKTITVNVASEGGTPCSMHHTDVTTIGSSTDEELTMVDVTMCNDGTEPMQVTGVSSTPGFTAAPFMPPSVCRFLFPDYFCPASNGFGQNINAGSCRDIYVLLSREGGAPSTATLTFTGHSASGSCGAGAACTDTVSLGGPVSCEIEPPSLTYAPREVARFGVTCRNLRGDAVACSGSNWYWADGLDGGFVERDNTHALAYSTSPSGTDGTLRYESGTALCSAFIEMDESARIYDCEFDPDSATLDIGESEYFGLICTVDDVETEPDDAEYDTTGGLDATTSGSSTDGTTLTGDGPSSGDLRGFGYFGDPSDDPIVGAIALAPVTITGEAYNDTNATNETEVGSRGEGSSEYCTIGDSSLLSTYPGSHVYLPIWCGPHGTDPCGDVSWRVSGPATILSESSSYIHVAITGASGSGTITAYVGGPGGRDYETCYKPFYIGTAECVEIS